jgi:uncharacterized LabA/DUF88 family protein
LAVGIDAVAVRAAKRIYFIRPLIDWLEYNGYTVVTKAAKELVDHSGPAQG